MSTRHGIFVLFTFVIATQTGCKRAEEKLVEKITERATGGTVHVHDGTATFSDPKSGGQMQVGKDVKLPDDWPKDVPIYPGARLASATVGANGKGGKTHGVQLLLETKDPPEEVMAYYKAHRGPYKLMKEVDVPTLRELELVNESASSQLFVYVQVRDRVTACVLAVAPYKT